VFVILSVAEGSAELESRVTSEDKNAKSKGMQKAQAWISVISAISRDSNPKEDPSDYAQDTNTGRQKSGGSK